MSEIEIVDAHHHLWDLGRLHYPWLSDSPPQQFRYGDTAPLRRNYLASDYSRDTGRQKVVATVHMEAEARHDDPVAETRFVHETAERYGFPNAVIGHARFESHNIDAVLRRHAAFPLLRGIRQKPATAASAKEIVPGAFGSMSDPLWRRGYGRLATYGLHFELQVPFWHLHEAAELARSFPEIPIVLNHAGLPCDRSESGLAAWREAMTAFAAEPNTWVKISGLGQQGRPWTAADNKPVVRATIDIFGVDRAMFASNFPVDGLCASFDRIYDGFRTIVAELPLADRRKLFSDNARRAYRIAL
ncbi:MAG: amidohydrolase family protein [Alphaproteobacteria bacterium]